MKTFLLSICVFFAVFATAYSIKCYSCGSLTGKDSGTACSKDTLEKNKDKTEVDCPAAAGYDQCIRYWAKSDDVTFIYNTCGTDALCKQLKDTCDKSDVDCAVGCCKDDLCNAGSPVSFSVFLTTVCSALGLALLK